MRSVRKIKNRGSDGCKLLHELHSYQPSKEMMASYSGVLGKM